MESWRVKRGDHPLRDGSPTQPPRCRFDVNYTRTCSQYGPVQSWLVEAAWRFWEEAAPVHQVQNSNSEGAFFTQGERDRRRERNLTIHPRELEREQRTKTKSREDEPESGARDADQGRE